MSQSISISVPFNHLAISSAATMLTKLAEDIKNETGPSACDDQLKPEPEAKEVFRSPLVEEVADSSNMAPEFIQADPVSIPTPPLVAETPAPPAPVEGDTTGPEDSLDANGLPWDARIHAATKTKDAKGNWKYLRGVDRDVLVPEVEAELREAMGAIPEPETGAVNTPPEPVAPTGIPTPPAPPAPAATPSTSVTTFAQLVTGITSKSIPEDKVSAALAAVGLQNFALLGARADLIPTVAGHLGL